MCRSLPRSLRPLSRPLRPSAHPTARALATSLPLVQRPTSMSTGLAFYMHCNPKKQSIQCHALCRSAVIPAPLHDRSVRPPYLYPPPRSAQQLSCPQFCSATELATCAPHTCTFCTIMCTLCKYLTSPLQHNISVLRPYFNPQPAAVARQSPAVRTTAQRSAALCCSYCMCAHPAASSGPSPLHQPLCPHLYRSRSALPPVAPHQPRCAVNPCINSTPSPTQRHINGVPRPTPATTPALPLQQPLCPQPRSTAIPGLCGHRFSSRCALTPAVRTILPLLPLPLPHSPLPQPHALAPAAAAVRSAL